MPKPPYGELNDPLRLSFRWWAASVEAFPATHLCAVHLLRQIRCIRLATIMLRTSSNIVTG
jgi:hypothetical protein